MLIRNPAPPAAWRRATVRGGHGEEEAQDCVQQEGVERGLDALLASAVLRRSGGDRLDGEEHAQI
jgi:hypothetical protein